MNNNNFEEGEIAEAAPKRPDFPINSAKPFKPSTVTDTVTDSAPATDVDRDRSGPPPPQRTSGDKPSSHIDREADRRTSWKPSSAPAPPPIKPPRREPVYGYPKDRFSAGSRAWMESRGAFPHGVSPEDWYYSSWDGYVGTGSGMYRDRDRERGWDRGYDDHLSHGGSYSHGYNQYPTRVPPPRHLPPPTLSRGITTGSVGYGGDVDSRGGRGDIYRSDPGSSLYYPESKAGYYAEGHYRDSTFSSRTGDLSHEKGCNNGQYSRDSRERSTSSERRPSGGNKSNPPVPAQPKPPSQPQPPTTPTASSSNPFNSSVKNSPPLRSSPSFTKSLLGDRQKQESTVHKEKVALPGPFKRSMTESLLHDKELSALKRSFDTAVPSGKGKKDLDASVIEAMLDVAKSKSYKKNVAKADSSDTVEKIPLASSSSSLKQRTVVLPPQPPQYGSISVDKREFDGKKEKVDLSLAEKLSMICSSNKSGSFSIDEMRHQQTIANSIPSLFGKKEESELSKEKAKTESADSKSTSGLSLENPKKRVAWGQGLKRRVSADINADSKKEGDTLDIPIPSTPAALDSGIPKDIAVETADRTLFLEFPTFVSIKNHVPTPMPDVRVNVDDPSPIDTPVVTAVDGKEVDSNRKSSDLVVKTNEDADTSSSKRKVISAVSADVQTSKIKKKRKYLTDSSDESVGIVFSAVKKLKKSKNVKKTKPSKKIKVYSSEEEFREPSEVVSNRQESDDDYFKDSTDEAKVSAPSKKQSKAVKQPTPRGKDTDENKNDTLSKPLVEETEAVAEINSVKPMEKTIEVKVKKKVKKKVDDDGKLGVARAGHVSSSMTIADFFNTVAGSISLAIEEKPKEESLVEVVSQIEDVQITEDMGDTTTLAVDVAVDVDVTERELTLEDVSTTMEDQQLELRGGKKSDKGVQLLSAATPLNLVGFVDDENLLIDEKDVAAVVPVHTTRDILKNVVRSEDVDAEADENSATRLSKLSDADEKGKKKRGRPQDRKKAEDSVDDLDESVVEEDRTAPVRAPKSVNTEKPRKTTKAKTDLVTNLSSTGMLQTSALVAVTTLKEKKKLERERRKQFFLFANIFSREADIKYGHSALLYMNEILRGSGVPDDKNSILQEIVKGTAPQKFYIPLTREINLVIDQLDTNINYFYECIKSFREKQYILEESMDKMRSNFISNSSHSTGSYGNLALANKRKAENQGAMAIVTKCGNIVDFASIQKNNRLRVIEAHVFATIVNAPNNNQTEIIAEPQPHLQAVALPSKITNNNKSYSSKKPAKYSSAAASHLSSRTVAYKPATPVATSRQNNRQAIIETVNNFMAGSKAMYLSPQELASFNKNVLAIKDKRNTMTKVIRERKLKTRNAWEQLGDKYLEVQHCWNSHITDQEDDEEVVRVGPTLRASTTAVRVNINGSGSHGDLQNAARPPLVPTGSAADRSVTLSTAGGNPVNRARVSTAVGIAGTSVSTTVTASSYQSAYAVARSEYEQDQLLEQMLTAEKKALKIAQGLCEIPSMLTPWPYADCMKAPKMPEWPNELREVTVQQDDIDEANLPKAVQQEEPFPSYQHDVLSVVDNNINRLTVDGKRQLCANMALEDTCPPNCNCASQLNKLEKFSRIWTDMEKCIFIDKFVQYPKNFSKIASFLANRTTQDCIKFYYDSKYLLELKPLLKEFENRRKQFKSSWNHTVKAAHLIGSAIYPPQDSLDNKDALVELPLDDASFCSFSNQPPSVSRLFNIPIPIQFHPTYLQDVEGDFSVIQPYPSQATIRQSIRKRLHQLEMALPNKKVKHSIQEELENLKASRAGSFGVDVDTCYSTRQRSRSSSETSEGFMDFSHLNVENDQALPLGDSFMFKGRTKPDILDNNQRQVRAFFANSSYEEIISMDGTVAENGVSSMNDLQLTGRPNTATGRVPKGGRGKLNNRNQEGGGKGRGANRNRRSDFGTKRSVAPAAAAEVTLAVSAEESQSASIRNKLNKAIENKKRSMILNSKPSSDELSKRSIDTEDASIDSSSQAAPGSQAQKKDSVDLKESLDESVEDSDDEEEVEMIEKDNQVEASENATYEDNDEVDVTEVDEQVDEKHSLASQRSEERNDSPSKDVVIEDTSLGNIDENGDADEAEPVHDNFSNHTVVVVESDLLHKAEGNVTKSNGDSTADPETVSMDVAVDSPRISNEIRIDIMDEEEPVQVMSEL